ncbi:unnamed protein product [Gemmataceae bacterium]|nr:unnamed protein product [Gemmataceae bacterium]VTU02014.1 unnamed protein product [Gemmataceae bacterium]
MTEPPAPEPEPEEITLEEWIAATQSCCGIEPESRRKPKPTPAPSAPADGAVQSTGIAALPSPLVGEGGRASRPGEG